MNSYLPELIAAILTALYLSIEVYKLFWLTKAQRELKLTLLAQRTCQIINQDRERTRAGVYNVRMH